MRKKEYKTLVVSQSDMENNFELRLNNLAKEGWTYTNHVYINSRPHPKEPTLFISIFSLVVERNAPVVRNVSIGLEDK